MQSSDCETQLLVTGIAVKSTPLGVRIINFLYKKAVNQ